MALWLRGCRPAPKPEAAEWSPLSFTAEDRVLVLAPHPDDEALGCGGIIQQAVAMQLPLRVVFFTYGDNNQWSFLVYRRHPVLAPEAVRRMGLVRRDEAIEADKLLGLSSDHLTFLGYPDFGTLQIWKAHWGDRPPFRSMLTHVTAVPYANAFRPGAPYKGEEVLKDLEAILREFRPTKVFVSHSGDQMPDHLALYLFTQVALWDVEPGITPALYPYLVHFKHWPSPRGDLPDRDLQPPASFRDEIAWQAHRLSPSERERKRAAIQAHRTQYGYNASYLLSFVRRNELFGDFPVVSLAADTASSLLSASRSEEAGKTPEQLTDEERAAFVGIEQRSAHREGNQLVLRMRFSRPLARAVKASVFVFGYRPDLPFEQMPKLHVELGELHHAIYDQDRLLPKESVVISRDVRNLTLRVPLGLLGAPQRVLTGARTYLGDVPLDWVSWRVLALSELKEG